MGWKERGNQFRTIRSYIVDEIAATSSHPIKFGIFFLSFVTQEVVWEKISCQDDFFPAPPVIPPIL